MSTEYRELAIATLRRRPHRRLGSYINAAAASVASGPRAGAKGRPESAFETTQCSWERKSRSARVNWYPARARIGQNLVVATVLVSLPGGEGVVREDNGATLVTEDVTGGGGSYVRNDDPYHPVKSWVDADRSVVGGLLPAGAVSAEVIDDRGTRVNAAVGDGAYVAIVEQPNDGHEPIVCCRDNVGRAVRRPLPAAYPSVRVTDADEPCPACGAVDYEEYVPTEDWRGGGVEPDGTITPSPVVVCRVCGQEEPEGTFYAATAASDEPEDESGRQARLDRARAEMRVQRWYSNALTLRAVTFPIYAAEGWVAQIGGSGSQGDHLTELTICHYDTPDADPYAGDLPRLEITTSSDDFGDEAWHARHALENWIRNDGTQAQWPAASHAALTLWLAARDRATRAQVLAASRSEQPIILEGAAEPFLLLTASHGPWVAVRRHEDLTITIAARDLKPQTITIEPIADPATRLLGPRPEGP